MGGGIGGICWIDGWDIGGVGVEGVKFGIGVG